MAVLIAVVVAAVMGFLGYRYYQQENQPPPEEHKAAVKKEKPNTAVYVRVTQCDRKNDRTESTGYIENVGNVDLHYVSINAIWKNADGLIIKYDRVLALNNGTLAPGKRKTFHAFTEAPAARCNAEAVDWW